MTRPLRGLAWLLLVVLAACATATVAPPSPAPAPLAPSESAAWIPVRDAAGQLQHLAARICRPARADAAPVAVINHGAPPDPSEIPLMQPTPCASPPAQWFLARGYLVVFALRRGYGASTGPIAEASGPCDSPDYVRAGVEGARDVDAVVRWAAAQPYARPDGVVVAGQSTGGWATIAYDAGPHPGVAGLISMAGGRGGRAFGGPRTYCRPERLVAAAGVFGATAHTPMLWVNATNDTFFDPDLTQAMQAAFTQAGGRAELVVTPPFDDEGHRLFYGEGGALVWGPLFARYIDGAGRVAARR